MKKLIPFLFLSCFVYSNSHAQITIATARTMAEGATVTVRGIVLNAGELGVIRYLQDPTGGIGAYGSSLSNVQRGDSIEVTHLMSFLLDSSNLCPHLKKII